MKTTLESVLAAMPHFPNLEFEITRAGLTHDEVAKAIGRTPATLKRKLDGKSGFSIEEIVKIEDLLKSAGTLTSCSFDYLTFCPRECMPSDAELDTARAIISTLHTLSTEGQTNEAMAHTAGQFDGLCWSRAYVLVSTLLNWATAGLLPGQAAAKGSDA